jgi:hypothetical protein
VTRDGGASVGWQGARRTQFGSVIVDPRPGTVYVSAWKKGGFRTSDGGRTWRPLERA